MMRLPKRIEFDSNKTNIVFVGNSLVYGDQYGGVTYRTWEAKLEAVAPILGSGISIVNLGHNGWNIPALTNGADSSTAFVEGKTNIMLFYEGTNSLTAGRSASNVFSDLATFCETRLSEHPWKIILVSTLPFYIAGWTDSDSETINANAIAFNSLMEHQHRALGCVGFANVRRPGTPWGSMPDYTQASFNASSMSTLWSSDRVHPSEAGNVELAKLLAPELRRARVR